MRQNLFRATVLLMGLGIAAMLTMGCGGAGDGDGGGGTPATVATGSVSGTVHIENSTSGVTDALATISGGGAPVFTDSQGFFRITDAPVGTRTLRISRTGFKTLEFTVVINEGLDTSIGTVEMERSSTGGSPIDPTGEGIVTGTVVSLTTGLPLSGAVVTISETSGFVFTNDEGEFSFPDVGAGTHTLTVSRSRYATYLTNVTVVGDQTVVVPLIAMEFVGSDGTFVNDKATSPPDNSHLLGALSPPNNGVILEDSRETIGRIIEIKGELAEFPFRIDYGVIPAPLSWDPDLPTHTVVVTDNDAHTFPEVQSSPEWLAAPRNWAPTNFYELDPDDPENNPPNFVAGPDSGVPGDGMSVALTTLGHYNPLVEIWRRSADPRYPTGEELIFRGDEDDVALALDGDGSPLSLFIEFVVVEDPPGVYKSIPTWFRLQAVPGITPNHPLLQYGGSVTYQATDLIYDAQIEYQRVPPVTGPRYPILVNDPIGAPYNLGLVPTDPGRFDHYYLTTEGITISAQSLFQETATITLAPKFILMAPQRPAISRIVGHVRINDLNDGTIAYDSTVDAADGVIGDDIPLLPPGRYQLISSADEDSPSNGVVSTANLRYSPGINNDLTLGLVINDRVMRISHSVPPPNQWNPNPFLSLYDYKTDLFNGLNRMRLAVIANYADNAFIHEDNVLAVSDVWEENVTLAVPDARIELVWDTEFSDLDLHFLRPSTLDTAPVEELFGSEHDCFFANRNPDWGVEGDPLDDPALDLDNALGFGSGSPNDPIGGGVTNAPETLVIQEMEEGLFRVLVEYFNDDGAGPSLATLTISLQGGPPLVFQSTLEQLRDVATIVGIAKNTDGTVEFRDVDDVPVTARQIESLFKEYAANP